MDKQLKNSTIAIPILLCSIIYTFAFASAVNSEKVPFGSVLFAGVCEKGKTGGGLFIVNNFRDPQPRVINILKGIPVTKGSLAGKTLDDGSFASPALSYDGRRILFSWAGMDDTWHIFVVNTDGTGLMQLTDGAGNDMDPCWMPNDRIAFVSDRRGKPADGFPADRPRYTLYSMKANGSDLFPISFHSGTERQPSVDNNGMLVYTKEYIVHDTVQYFLTISHPDGKIWFNAQNYYVHPYSLSAIKAIPNTSSLYTGIDIPLYSTTQFGKLLVVNIATRDNSPSDQIMWSSQDASFATPWPIDSAVFLCSRQGDIVIVHRQNAVESVCTRVQAGVSNNCLLLNPIPLAACAPGPVYLTSTCQGERADLAGNKKATFMVINANLTAQYTVDQSPKATTLRIVELKPTLIAGRTVLQHITIGIVPVESDGSVYAEAPVGRSITLEALDNNGAIVRSLALPIYIHPCEDLTLYGINGDCWTPPPPPAMMPLALTRAPSSIDSSVGQAVTMSLLTNGDIAMGSSIAIAAKILSGKENVQSVDFYIDGMFIGSDSTNNYQELWQNAQVGEHVVHAKAYSRAKLLVSSASCVIPIALKKANSVRLGRGHALPAQASIKHPPMKFSIQGRTLKSPSVAHGIVLLRLDSKHIAKTVQFKR